MKKNLIYFICLAVCLVGLAGCSKGNDQVKIGVSMGVGAATRWDSEKIYMEETANELGADIEVIINRSGDHQSQVDDCIKLIDSGIQVLILTPMDVTAVNDILEYARFKKVSVISYARAILNEKIDLFVGQDNNRIGQKMGQYLSEMVTEGNYIILKGDAKDSNAKLLFDGAMRYIKPIEDKINIILNSNVENWSPEKAKELVKAVIIANNNKIDAILAPNDKIAGACAEVIEELQITNHVAITGMDGELDAIKRIVNKKQDMTVYFNLKELATVAVQEAYHLATNQSVQSNSKFDNGYSEPIDSYLLVGDVVTYENIQRVIIDTGVYSYDEIYETVKE